MEGTRMHQDFRKISAVVNVGLAIAVLALVVFWSEWRLVLQAEGYSGFSEDYYDSCSDEEQACLAEQEEQEEMMGDCLDAADEVVQKSCADLSDEPSLYCPPGHPAASSLPNCAPAGQSEQQKCENALLIGGSYTTGNGVTISGSASVNAVGVPSIGVSVGSRSPTTHTYSGLYSRCMDKYGTNFTREHDCAEKRIRCERTYTR
jgi:hypothetical protein